MYCICQLTSPNKLPYTLDCDNQLRVTYIILQELYDMASEPKEEHSYILDSFEEFEALARRALHEGISFAYSVYS